MEGADDSGDRRTIAEGDPFCRETERVSNMAMAGGRVRDAERTGTRSVAIKGSDPLAVYRSFVALTYITRVAEGRQRRPPTLRMAVLLAQRAAAPDLAVAAAL